MINIVIYVSWISTINVINHVISTILAAKTDSVHKGNGGIMLNISKLGILSVLMASAAQGAVVINPVPMPIAPGMKVGLAFVGQAQASGDAALDGFRARLQSLRSAPDASGRLFVNDTRGTISVIGPNGGMPQTWFDIRKAVAGFSNASNPGQTGLISFAFHPNFAADPSKPGYDVFYTMDTCTSTGTATLAGKGPTVDHDNVLHEFRMVDPMAATATIASQREVLRVAQPFSDHGPGTIAFNGAASPESSDYGKLYIGFGDGGGVGDPYGNAQDPNSPFGKILRIDPTPSAGGQAYTIPADNPHNGVTGQSTEIWASGLRNPQQFSWDRVTGQMLIIDIGQSQLEEVNIGVAGANYGWPAREGTFSRGSSNDPNVYDTPINDGRYRDPIAQFDHEEIGRSGMFNLAAVSGAFAYTGNLISELRGMAIVSELVSGRVFYFDPVLASGSQPAELRELEFNLDGIDTTLFQLDGNPYLSGRVDLRIGSDNAGELYLFSKSLGNIYSVNSIPSVPEPTAWMMLIVGIGLVGSIVRRRRTISGSTAA